LRCADVDLDTWFIFEVTIQRRNLNVEDFRGLEGLIEVVSI
jgi:hypothetical protein